MGLSARLDHCRTIIGANTARTENENLNSDQLMPEDKNAHIENVEDKLFWQEHDHDGQLEIRSPYRYSDQEWAIIYPGKSRFTVRIYFGEEGEYCETSVFSTLEEAKRHAEEFLFRNQ
jgi:hypothetical protein